MKSFLFSLVLISVFYSESFAQNKSIAQVEKALETLRSQMLNPSEEGLKAVSHSALSYGHSNGRIENQKEFMEAFLTGTSDFTTLDFSEVKIEILGNTAIVRHILQADSNDKGKQPAKVNIKVMLVFVKDKNAWKLAGRQAVKYL